MPVSKSAPVEIPDAEHELVIERAAAIDVAKAAGKVCVRLTGKSGRRFSRVWDVSARTGAITELAEQLVELGIGKVTVESTSDYWRIWYYLLEDAGLDVQLVNARDVKNAPGRPKTDKLDAVWLAKLTEKGLLRPSFVPPAPIRVLRDYTRLREDLTRERSRYWQRLEKLLEDAAIKVSAVASTMSILSVRDMLEALIAGEKDPRRLADLARGRLKTKRSELIAALDGRFDEHHAELARLLLGQIDALTDQIAALSARIEQLIAAMDDADHHSGDRDGSGTAGLQVTSQSNTGEQTPTPGSGTSTATGPQIDTAPVIESTRLTAVERLDEITGVGQRAAQTIIAEIGLDMARFPTPEHLVSWAKLCPRTVQSGPVIRGGKTGKGNPYLKGALGEAAAAAARTDTFLGERYRRIVKRRGKLKALVAVARSILTIVWQLLSNPAARFHDLGADYHTNRVTTERKIRNHIAHLTAMGFHVTLEPAA
ncbi:IS110 family transposase [Mycobacterium riyadhense]|uniref:IS110 family transposase n=1 Tax=Mycobacterium riyadhense TaxID=486698 RepID=UPI001959E665|nr:IS110 family transposase [Mycobacterium riyadhense]